METQTVTTSALIAEYITLKREHDAAKAAEKAAKETLYALRDELYAIALEAGTVDSEGRPCLKRYTGIVYFTVINSHDVDYDSMVEALGLDVVKPLAKTTVNYTQAVDALGRDIVEPFTTHSLREVRGYAKAVARV